MSLHAGLRILGCNAGLPYCSSNTPSMQTREWLTRQPFSLTNGQTMRSWDFGLMLVTPDITLAVICLIGALGLFTRSLPC